MVCVDLAKPGLGLYSLSRADLMVFVLSKLGSSRTLLLNDFYRVWLVFLIHYNPGFVYFVLH